MDVVNKWLLLVFSFMAAALIVLFYTGGTGRYAINVQPGIDNTASVVYVLDTKTGEVQAKIVSEEAMLNSNGKPSWTPNKVFELKSWSRGY